MVLNVHVGGGADRFGNAAGIHWHMNIANKIEYIATDDKRQVIPWVRLTNRDGKVEEFQVDDVTSAAARRAASAARWTAWTATTGRRTRSIRRPKRP